MTLTEAINTVIARTGVERYRYLCLEHPSPTVRQEYTDHVLRLAAGTDQPDRPTAAESLRLLAEVRRCPYRSSTGRSGCDCGYCGIRQAKVSRVECLDCVRQYPEPR